MAVFDADQTSDNGSRAIDIERYAKLLSAVQDSTVVDLTKTFVTAMIDSGQFTDRSKLRAVAQGITEAMGDRE